MFRLNFYDKIKKQLNCYEDIGKADADGKVKQF